MGVGAAMILVGVPIAVYAGSKVPVASARLGPSGVSVVF
jgi:hypothetical protein